jgi:hypothetical protein
MELLPDGEESEEEVVDFQADAEAELVEELGWQLPWPILMSVNWKPNHPKFKGQLLRAIVACV